MAMVIVDDSELKAYARAMRVSAEASMTAIVATTVRAGKNIQREAKDLAPKGGHLKSYAGMITTSTKTTPWSVEVEVGPLQRGQGALGALVEFGQARNAPHPHLMPAADHELPTWLNYLGQALGAGL